MICEKIDDLPHVHDPKLLSDVLGAPKPASELVFRQSVRRLTTSTLVSIEMPEPSCPVAGCSIHLFRAEAGGATPVFSLVGTGQMAVLTSQTEFSPEDLEATVRFE